MKLNMKHLAFLLVMPLLFITLSRQTSAQVFKAGPQVATFYSEIDDSEQPYGLYVPPGYTPETSYPLVIMLHGAMSNHRLALRRVFGKSNMPGQNDAEASRVFPPWKAENYIVATPYARGTMGYMGVPEADVMKVIEACREHFNIDENRIYLTGLSMGGGGTLYLGLTRPSLFAAIAPVCPAPPAEAYDLMGNALNLPVNIYQGGADPVVRAEGTRQIVDELLKGGASVEYHEFPGVQHDVWVQSYANGNIFRWFDEIVRNPHPDRVQYRTQWLRYNQAYWVNIDQKKPGETASIDVRFTGKNSVEMKAENVEAFTLSLKGHPSFDAAMPLQIRINNVAVQSAPKFSHAFTQKEGKWVAGKYEAPVLAKKRGLEGPMSEILTGRFLVVYGTEGTSGMEEVNARRKFAREMADFAVGFGGYEQPGLINPRVISDKQVTADDYLSSNLVLVGTRESNGVIAKLADKLPLHLTAKSDEYGLAYCYPVNGKMTLVISGIPFWQSGQPQAGQPGQNRSRTRISFGTGAGLKALQGKRDVLFFKGVGGEPLIDGYFDNDWKLPAGFADVIKATGAAEVK